MEQLVAVPLAAKQRLFKDSTRKPASEKQALVSSRWNKKDDSTEVF